MNLERAFNVRHGLTPDDDYNVPERILEGQNDGPCAGVPLRPHLKGMINEYYRLMGWDEKTGKPWKSTLDRLGLNEIAEDLWG
jgi:aldehyde:ferredoxin oxidoreductase